MSLTRSISVSIQFILGVVLSLLAKEFVKVFDKTESFSKVTLSVIPPLEIITLSGSIY